MNNLKNYTRPLNNPIIQRWNNTLTIQILNSIFQLFVQYNKTITALHVYMIGDMYVIEGFVCLGYQA